MAKEKSFEFHGSTFSGLGVEYFTSPSRANAFRKKLKKAGFKHFSKPALQITYDASPEKGTKRWQRKFN